MSTSLPRTRAELEPLLAAHGLRLSKRLGQNLLIDAALADAIVADAGVTERDAVIEIGPGAGGLTQPLLAAAGRVLAVELDRGFARLLDEHLTDARLTLIHGDCLEGPEGLHPAIVAELTEAREAFDRVLVVANLPYSCGTAAVSRLLRRDDAPDAIVAMLQREVVDRLRAAPGTSDYGPLAVITALRADVELLRTVPREVFFPRPQVASAVFRLSIRAGDAGRARDAADLAELAFRSRRKRVAKGLAGRCTPDQLTSVGIDPDVRPERISPDEWATLAEAVG